MTNNETGAANALVIIFEHEEWRIYELAPASYDRRAGNTLVFETADGKRHEEALQIEPGKTARLVRDLLP